MPEPADRPAPGGPRSVLSAARRVAVVDHAVRAARRYVHDGGMDHAAALTYYTLAAIFPLLLLVTSMLGYLLRYDHGLYDRVVAQIGARPELTSSVQAAVDLRSVTSLVALGGLLWIGTGWVAALRRAVRRIWHLPATDRGFVTGRVLDLWRLGGLALLLAGSIGLAVVGSTVGAWLTDILGAAPIAVRLVSAVTWLLGFVIDTAFVAWLFAMAAGPWRRLWRDVLGGVVLGSLGLAAIKIAGAEVYGAAIRHYQARYTAAAVSLLATLLLMRAFSSVLTFAAAWCVTGPGCDDAPPSGTAPDRTTGPSTAAVGTDPGGVGPGRTPEN